MPPMSLLTYSSIYAFLGIQLKSCITQYYGSVKLLIIYLLKSGQKKLSEDFYY